jgi:hypothetical protein
MSKRKSKALTNIASTVTENFVSYPPDVAIKMLADAAHDDVKLGQTARALMPMLICGLMTLDAAIEKKVTKKPKGRPPKPTDEGGVDGWRAYNAWRYVQMLGLGSMSNREVIHTIQSVENQIGLAPNEQTFPSHLTTTSAEQSLSRGKRILGIVDKWECPYCEGIQSLPD